MNPILQDCERHAAANRKRNTATSHAVAFLSHLAQLDPNRFDRACQAAEQNRLPGNPCAVVAYAIANQPEPTP